MLLGFGDSIVILLELIVAVQIMKMMMPLRLAVNLHMAARIGALDFEDANSTCCMSEAEEESIGRGPDDFVVEHIDPRWLEHVPSDLRLAFDRFRLVIHTPFNRRDMV